MSEKKAEIEIKHNWDIDRVHGPDCGPECQRIFILPASSVPSDDEIRDLFDEWVAAPGCTGCQRDFARVVLNHMGLTIGGE